MPAFAGMTPEKEFDNPIGEI